jgi:hypothetical protein
MLADTRPPFFNYFVDAVNENLAKEKEAAAVVRGSLRNSAAAVSAIQGYLQDASEREQLRQLNRDCQGLERDYQRLLGALEGLKQWELKYWLSRGQVSN